MCLFRWQISMKSKDKNCREGEALGAALGLGPGEGMTFPLLLAFPSCFLTLFETKGEDKRKIALLEGTKAQRGYVPPWDRKRSCPLCWEIKHLPPNTCLHKFTLKCLSTYYKFMCPEVEGEF